MRVASTWSTMPDRRAMIVTPESRATGLLHAGADERRLGADQRHRLALHVRAHQRAVCVVVLEERDQRRRHRNQLLWRDVDQVDVLRPLHHEIAALAAIRQVGDDPPFRIGLDIGLGDRRSDPRPSPKDR